LRKIDPQYPTVTEAHRLELLEIRSQLAPHPDGKAVVKAK